MHEYIRSEWTHRVHLFLRSEWTQRVHEYVRSEWTHRMHVYVRSTKLSFVEIKWFLTTIKYHFIFTMVVISP